MTRRGDRFEYEFPRDPWGHALAAEIETGGRVRRIPGLDAEAPYLVVPSLSGPTPLIYSSEEALTYLDPAALDPAAHGLLLISSRAWNFHRSFNVPLQRKVLDPVRRGMTLVVLAQDYAPGRYTLDWLPRPLQVEARRDRIFDPAGALGLVRIEDDDILRQRFLPSPGWDVPGNGGLAQMTWGAGTDRPDQRPAARTPPCPRLRHGARRRPPPGRQGKAGRSSSTPGRKARPMPPPSSWIS